MDEKHAEPPGCHGHLHRTGHGRPGQATARARREPNGDCSDGPVRSPHREALFRRILAGPAGPRSGEKDPQVVPPVLDLAQQIVVRDGSDKDEPLPERSFSVVGHRVLPRLRLQLQDPDPAPRRGTSQRNAADGPHQPEPSRGRALQRQVQATETLLSQRIAIRRVQGHVGDLPRVFPRNHRSVSGKENDHRGGPSHTAERLLDPSRDLCLCALSGRERQSVLRAPAHLAPRSRERLLASRSRNKNIIQ
mmetsp:Transcript_29988/g.62679  ORF Transcript_29988/g.62679 Transcript_29988/m.62679 type:complete len:249 (+) Transcript_29988:676-1422(+)